MGKTKTISNPLTYDNKPVKTRIPLNKFEQNYNLSGTDCRLPVIISIFAQESSCFTGEEFASHLDKEIEKISNDTGPSPIYFMLSPSTSSELLIAQYLIKNGQNVILVGTQQNNPYTANCRYISTKSPTDFMLDCSWAMFAFWDGKKGGAVGKNVETAVVKMLKGLRDERNTAQNYEIRFPNTCEIVHFIIDRPELNIKNYEERYLYAHFAETGTDWFYVNSENVKKLNDGNRAKEKKKNIEKNNKTLSLFNKAISEFEFTDKKAMVDDLIPVLFKDNARINDIRNRFVVYDNLSLVNRNKRLKQSGLLIFIATVALILFEVFSNLYSAWWLLAIYAALFVGVFLIYRKVNKSRVHENYIYSRVLSEAMRAQCYWYAIGLNKSVRYNYPIAHRTDLEWLYRSILAIHAVNISLGGNIGNSNEAKNVDYIKSLWIGKEEYKNQKVKIYGSSQLSYFHNSTAKKEKASKKSQRLVKVVSIFSFVAALILIAVVCVTRFISFDFVDATLLDKIELGSIFTIGLLPILIAAATTSSAIKSYKEEATRHKWSEILTKRVLTDIELDSSETKIRQVFTQYGEQVINENGDWALMKLERRPEYIKN